MSKKRGGFRILLAIVLLALANVFCGSGEPDANEVLDNSEALEPNDVQQTSEAVKAVERRNVQAAAEAARAADEAAAAARAAEEVARAAQEAAQAAEDSSEATRAAEAAAEAARLAEEAAAAARAAEEAAAAAQAAEEDAEQTRAADEARLAEEEAEAARIAEEATAVAQAAVQAAEATRVAEEAAHVAEDDRSLHTDQQPACSVDQAGAQQLALNSETEPIPTDDECWYRVNVPAGVGLMTVELEAQNGAFDLFLDSGPATSTADVVNADNRLNFNGPIEEVRTYAYSEPFGDYTLVIAAVDDGTFDLRIGTGGLGEAQDASSCGVGVCASVFSITPNIFAGGVHIGSEFGDRVIFPIDIPCPGLIQARADWLGSAETLALILNGPGQVGYFDRQDGRTPLNVQHSITAANIQNGSRWYVTLTNFSRGEAFGRVTIEYPHCGGEGGGELQPTLTFTGSEAYEANGRQWVRYLLNVANWSSFPAEFFQPAPDLPPCGANNNSARAWVHIYDATNDQRIYGFCALGSPEGLTRLWFAEEQGVDPPASLYIVIEDRLTGDRYVSNNVAP